MSNQLTLLEQAGVFIERDFIDIRLCRRLLGEVRQTKTFRSGGILKGEKEILNESYHKVLVTDKLVMQAVTDKLIAIKPRLEAEFKVKLVDYQGPQFMFYQEGSFYSPHTGQDSREDSRDETKRRRVSAVIFVNGERETDGSDDAEIDPYAGGELVFYDLLSRKQAAAAGLSLTGQPRLYVVFEKARRVIRYGLSLHGQPGLLVAFDSSVLHEVKPVTVGERLTIVTCFLGE